MLSKRTTKKLFSFYKCVHALKKEGVKREAWTLSFYLLFLSFMILEFFTFQVMNNSQKKKWPVLKKASLYGR